jgi:hypothetical protein
MLKVTNGIIIGLFFNNLPIDLQSVIRKNATNSNMAVLTLAPWATQQEIETIDIQRKIDCIRFVMCPLLAPYFKPFFLAVAINSTNEANKAGSMCH